MDTTSVLFRQATVADLSGILALLATRDEQALRRLQWVPEPYQTKYLYDDLQKGRIFVAVNEEDGMIIAQRKVFIVEDLDELSALMVKDLRCAHEQRVLLMHGFFDQNYEFFQQASRHFEPHDRIMYFYVGSAFTHPLHRKKNINEQLNVYAYESLRTVVVLNLTRYRYTSLALLYTLVHENRWRTPLLARHFFSFAQSVSTNMQMISNSKLHFYTYKRIKPEFEVNPDGQLVQLPDDRCVPGRGCVLLYKLC